PAKRQYAGSSTGSAAAGLAAATLAGVCSPADGSSEGTASTVEQSAASVFTSGLPHDAGLNALSAPIEAGTARHAKTAAERASSLSNDLSPADLETRARGRACLP